MDVGREVHTEEYILSLEVAVLAGAEYVAALQGSIIKDDVCADFCIALAEHIAAFPIYVRLPAF